MKELHAIFDILKADTAPGVLATLVKVEGSSYRRVGARLLWRPDGTRVGSISGGCLEEDLIERARAVLQSGRSEVVVYDTTEENDLVWGVGLGCHGIVHVLLERVVGFPAHWALVEKAWQRRQSAVLGLNFGSGDGERGTRFAMDEAGAVVWVAREDKESAVKEAKRCFLSQHFHYTGPSETAGQLLCEYLPPPLRVVVFGAGDDAIPFCRLTKELGWRLAVCDPRAAYATAGRFPMADEVRVAPPEAASSLAWDPLTIAVVMTHHYRFDLPILRAILPLGLRYIGLLGPKKRAEKILSELSADGLSLSDETRSRFHAPVGLDLGSGTPEEVALAIVAEIQAVMAQRGARPLRERSRPIHE